jgi:nitronate monooxygenase
MAIPDALRRGLKLPAIAAPMFLVSGPEMVLAAHRAGIVGSFPANNARSLEDLERWLAQISSSVDPAGPPWAINIMVHRSYARWQEELALVQRYRVPLVISALGSPAAIVEPVHSYGGWVFADVNSLSFARKAAATGVDGLILVSAGAGGHTGQLAGFAFAPAVREFFNGVIVLAGGIGSGQAIRAAELLGADLAYLGTRLIACQESLAEPAYKSMLVEAHADDIVLSAALTGVPANWLRQSLIAAGYDPANMPERAPMQLGRPEDEGRKRWKEVWSAGHGVDAIHAMEPLGNIISQLRKEYQACVAQPPSEWA